MSHTLKRLTPTAPQQVNFAIKAKVLDQDPDTTQSEANSAQFKPGYAMTTLHTLHTLHVRYTHYKLDLGLPCS